MSPHTITIKIGEQGENFLKRNNLPSKNHITKQPAGLNFYRHRWPIHSHGEVIIEHGKYSFTLPYVLSIMGTEDAEHMDAGLAAFDINAGITATDTVAPNEARKAFIALLQKLLSLGWKPLISYDSPRLTGEQAYLYSAQENDYFALPADYSPTLEQWMQINSGNWYLYAEDIFLEISFRRGAESKDLAKATYLFSFSLHTKEEEAKVQFESKDRDHWHELWADKIKAMKKERYAKEKELIQRGFTIYTDYQEPQIHPLDPIEP